MAMGCLSFIRYVCICMCVGVVTGGVCVSCHQVQDTEAACILRVSEFVRHKDVHIHELTDSIGYVALETSDRVLLGDIVAAKFAGGYYFVQDYIYNPPFWEIYLKCDVLASHRNNIAKTNAYVLRSASTYDLSIRDTMYPATSDPVTYVDIPISSNPFTSDAQKGTYVLGVINGESTMAQAWGL